MANSNEYMRDYMLKRYHRRRADSIAQLGGKCVECGTTENLEFDHIDSNTKTRQVARILASGSKKLVAEELAKCQLLCKEHHSIKTVANQENNRHLMGL